MYNASDAARIKVWPNSPSALSGDLQGGGGSGRVNNVTYQNIYSENVDYAIEVSFIWGTRGKASSNATLQITQCYGQKNLTLCTEFPSPLTIENITFRNFTGTTSKKYEPYMATLECSSSTVCNGITATDINVLTPKGSHQATCLNMDETTLDVTCVDVKV